MGTSMKNLYIVATPIGNLEDITLRALRILKEVPTIFAEDTRVTKKLLSHYDIRTQVFSYHAHSGEVTYDFVLEKLDAGDVALVTDAGTPGISDPGSELVSFVRSRRDDVQIVAIPGPSALTAAISISGIHGHEFLFLGFLPHKKGRETLVKKIAESEMPVIVYESTHRIVKFLESLVLHAPTKRVTVVKEITKIHERVLVGTPAELVSRIAVEDVDLAKGEFVVIIES